MHFGNGRLCLIFNNISCLLVKVIFLTFWGCVFSKPDAVICWGTSDLQSYSAFKDNQLLWWYVSRCAYNTRISGYIVTNNVV